MDEALRDDYRDDSLPPIEILARRLEWFELDLPVCEVCGREWKYEEIDDPQWFVDTVLTRNEAGGIERNAQIRCPDCW